MFEAQKTKNTLDVEEIKKDINQQKIQLETLPEKFSGFSHLCYAKIDPGKTSDAIGFSRSPFTTEPQHQWDPSSAGS